MKTVALIPARAGSKGLPEKNIRYIAGKPLIAWSIEQALVSHRVSEVFVSTNSPKIAAISKNYGAIVPFLRPNSISGDVATTESAVIHFCDYMLRHGKRFENILLIQCTSPVRAKERFDDAISVFLENSYDSLVSVAASHRFYWKDLRCPTPMYDYRTRPRRQDILEKDKAYFETGSFYIFKRDKFLNEKNRICGNVGLYETPENEMFDIDGITDFSICESLLNLSKKGQGYAA